MARKPNLKKYRLIIGMIMRGYLQSAITEMLSCSFGTIQRAIDWFEEVYNKSIAEHNSEYIYNPNSKHGLNKEQWKKYRKKIKKSFLS
jgi:hypothetical protein